MNNTSKTNPNNSITLKGGEISDYIAMLIGKASGGMIILAIASVVQMFRIGIQNRYWILLAGALISVACLLVFLFIVAFIDKGQKKYTFLRVLGSIAAFIPYLFGCYLTFYEGLWRLIYSISPLSITALIISIIFIILGFSLVSATYKSSEFAKNVDAGSIKIID